MSILGSDDLSIGPFVRAFPGSAQTSGCQSCSTWETRQEWADARRVDDLTVRFLESRTEPYTKLARSTRDSANIAQDVQGSGLVEALESYNRQWYLERWSQDRSTSDRSWDDDQSTSDRPWDDDQFTSEEYRQRAPDGPPWRRWEVVDGGPGLHCFGPKLAPPPFSSTMFYTQISFFVAHGIADWPAAPSCPPPCKSVKALCPYPSKSSVVNLQVIFPSGTYHSDILKSGDFSEYSLNRPDALAMVELAMGLLNENIDLVEWVVCLAYTWNPRIPRHVIDNRINQVLKMIRGEDIWVPFQGGPASTAIFLVDHPSPSSTAWATTQDVYKKYSGTMGVVIPFNHWVWQDAMAQTAKLDSRGLCAIAVLAETLIHEFIHIASDQKPGLPGVIPFGAPGVISWHVDQDLYTEADDGLQSWAPQNMASISFLWALAQRYPCLQNLLCCPKTGGDTFMTSEPDIFSAFGWEKAPWDYDRGANCSWP